MIGDRDLNRDDLPFPLDRPLTGQDLMRLLPHLLQPLWSQAAHAVRVTVGQVTALKTGPRRVTIDTGGRDVDARYLAGYTPTIGDLVLVLRNQEKAIVLGKLA